MARYLLLGDIHLADRPPSSCTDSYRGDLLELLMQTVRIAREREVAAVAWAGDVFHIKTPGRTSHRLVQQVINLCKSYGCPVYIVPGNHDVTHDRMESLASQPLGTLFASGAATLLAGWAPEHPVLYGVPWQQTWDDPHVTEALGSFRDKGRFGGLVIAHAPLYPPGRELPYEFYPAGDWAQAMGGGSCFYGHVHEPHGTYQEGGVTFCNNGALSRGSLHEYNLTRPVGCTLWDSSTGQFEFVPLRARPASEVFRLTEARQAVDAQGKLDDFLDSIQATSLDVVSIEGVMAHIREQQVGAQCEALIAELLEEAGA